MFIGPFSRPSSRQRGLIDMASALSWDEYAIPLSCLAQVSLVALTLGLSEAAKRRDRHSVLRPSAPRFCHERRTYSYRSKLAGKPVKAQLSFFVQKAQSTSYVCPNRKGSQNNTVTHMFLTSPASALSPNGDF